MVKKVWGGLILFWGVVAVVVVLNALNIFSFSWTTSQEAIHFPLQERFGIVLKNEESCVYQYKTHTFSEPLEIKTICSNGKCNTNVIFSNSLIPSEVGLYVKEGTSCVHRSFRVNALQTLGYQTTVYLSDAEKARLGMVSGDTFKLQNAYGSELCGVQTVFYYNTNITEDTLLVNGKPKATVYFDIGQNLNLKPNKYGMIQDSTYSSDGKLFSYICSNETQCIRKANTNVVLAEGIYVEVDADFVEQCTKNEMDGIQDNPYCKHIIYQGQMHQIDATKEEIERLLQKGENPKEGIVLDQHTQEITKKIYGACQASK